MKLLQLELTRPAFDIDSMEVCREVHIAGGTFEVRIDRIDTLTVRRQELGVKAAVS